MSRRSGFIKSWAGVQVLTELRIPSAEAERRATTPSLILFLLLTQLFRIQLLGDVVVGGQYFCGARPSEWTKAGV